MTEKPLISIIDDDPFMRESIRQLIKSFGYTVATFSSALAFLKSPDLKQTSCLIADVQMPGMTGDELYGRLVHDGPGIYLGISETTVNVHRSNLMHKMKAASIAELGRIADKLNLIPDKLQISRNRR